jgi:hypothetical protein
MGLMRTCRMSALISGKSASVAGRRENSANHTCRNQNNKRRDKPVDQERIQERARAPGDPAEDKAAENRGQRLDFRLADVRQRKRDRLQPERFRSELAGIAKQDPAAEEELPADQVEKGSPGQAVPAVCSSPSCWDRFSPGTR